MSRWVLFGGRFDPVHRGHLAMADWLYTHLPNFEKCVFVPTGIPPHRNTVTSAYHRYAMLALALQDRPWAILWDDEIRRPSPAYTIDTLTRFHAVFGTHPDEVVFVMGADAYLAYHTWYRYPEHLQLCTFCVFLRPPIPVQQVLAYHQTRLPNVPVFSQTPDPWPSPPAVVVVADLQIDISATAIRTACGTGDPFAQWVLPPVAAYIQRHGLYRTHGEKEG